MTGNHWGRLQVDIDCQLRRGAWYRVTELESLQAILDVNRRRLAIPTISSWSFRHRRGAGPSCHAPRTPVCCRRIGVRRTPFARAVVNARPCGDARAGWTAAAATESSTSPGTKPTSRTDAGAPLTE